jgi:phosphoglycolate phosphatase-like HAD superfamily hydrolase
MGVARAADAKAGVTSGNVPVAIDLDGALGDTNELWRDWLESVKGLFGPELDDLPADRGSAAAELDRLGAGNWRTLLERYAEDRAPVYLRRDPTTGGALRALAASGRRLGVFTDAPEPLARIALEHLGADRRVSALETGADALDRLLAVLGTDAVVIRTAAELLDASA